jgi:hypothetical protein
MFDQEIASLLEEAGYQFNPTTGLYRAVTGAAEGEQDHSSEYVADELGIPLEDLVRWEGEQTSATTGEQP